MKKKIKAWLYTWPDRAWQVVPKRLSKETCELLKLKETRVEIIFFVCD